MAKKNAAGQQNYFFGFFSFVAHLCIETKFVCSYQNFISSAVQRNHGGDKIALRQRRRRHRRQRQQQQRTPQTIIIARQDSQNPRANKSKD